MKLDHGREGSGLLEIQSMAAAHLGSASRHTPIARVSAAVEAPSLAAPTAIVPAATTTSSRRTITALAAIGAVEILVIAVCGVLIATRAPAATPRAMIAKGLASVPTAIAVTPPLPAVVTAPTRASAAPVAVVAAPEPPPPEPAVVFPPLPSKAAPSKGSALVRHSPPTKLAEPATPTTARGACDEISCIADATGWCCPRLLATTAPTSIDAHAVGIAMAQIHDRAITCHAKSGAKGKVRVHLTVDPDGRISKAAIETTPEAALGECVLHAAQSAQFKRTDRGGSFGYSFDF